MIMRKDLADISDADFETRRDEFMECQECGEEMGGTQGDFFSLPMNWVFHCPECGNENIAIVRRVFKTQIVKQ